MANVNPYPWVMPSVAAANGYGTVAASDDGGGIGTPSKKKPVLKAPASPDPRTTGAMGAGMAAAQAGANARDAGITGINSALSSGAQAVNRLTAPVRAGLGDVTDFVRGFAGDAPRAGVGRPVAGIVAPQLAYPSAPAARPTSRGIAAPPAMDAWLAAQRPSDNVLMLGSDGTTRPVGSGSGPTPITNIDSTGHLVSPGQMTARLQGNGGAPASRPAAAGIDTGVTLADGRKLNYGAMVNGVPTFSDGSGAAPGQPGAIPRTMTQADITSLGARLPTVPAGTAPAGFPSGVPFNSDNTDANVAGIMRSREGGKFVITPEMNAAADLAAISNRDPRSSLGRAALNLSRDASGASTVLQRKAALGALGGMDEGAIRNYLATTQGTNSLNDINAQGQNVLRRTALAGDYDLAGIDARNAGEMDRARLAGNFGLQEANARASQKPTVDLAKLNANALGQVDKILGVDANGQILDAKTGKMRYPTLQERQQALQTARAMLRPDLYGGTAQGLGAQPTAGAPPNAAQIAMLKQNPSLRAAFDSKFGAGSAARVLGN